MEGDVVQHLPAVKGNQTIGDNLQELPWYTPNPNKKKIDCSAIQSKNTKIMKMQPKKHLVKKTKARILAEKNPPTKIPDSEICIENIIPGSPSYVPYKRKKGKDSRGSKLKNTIHDLGMVRTKQTPRLSEMTMEEKKHMIRGLEIIELIYALDIWCLLTGIGKQPRMGKPHISSW